MIRDKKFLILVGLIIFLPLLTVVLTSILQGCENRGSSYNVYEKNMIKAAKKYFRNNKLEPTIERKISKVSLSTLVSNKYIKSSESSLKDSSCTGSVTARMNGVSLEKNKGGFINYLVNLNCKNYKTPTLIDSLKENSSDSESGLYKNGSEYIFKGEKPRNYITFYDKNYRIMGITSDGLIKLIKSEYETLSRMWDNKYNLETRQSNGKSIYKDSLILNYLTEDYFNEKKISSAAREHIIFNNVCIGKRSKSDTRISKEIDCQEVIQNQPVSLMTASDFFLASTDPDCNSILSRSCNNYNYLKKVANSSWTSNSVTENTYEVLNLSGGVIISQTANTYNFYNIVIYIDGNEKVKSGSGTFEDPYIIK